MSLDILFHFLFAQHVSDINIFISYIHNQEQYDQCGNSTE